jgi:multidrug efflux pump subunit AcrB
MRQKLTVNLAVFVILVAGIYSLSGLNRESIPQISWTWSAW